MRILIAAAAIHDLAAQADVREIPKVVLVFANHGDEARFRAQVSKDDANHTLRFGQPINPRPQFLIADGITFETKTEKLS